MKDLPPDSLPREKLLARMRELLASVGAEPDELRLIQETALFADRSNFTEELVRLRSHIDQFCLALSAADAVGRKLDFIIQEVPLIYSYISNNVFLFQPFQEYR